MCIRDSSRGAGGEGGLWRHRGNEARERSGHSAAPRSRERERVPEWLGALWWGRRASIAMGIAPSLSHSG
eukprot:1537504-Alexandrium_andersonii.AAC.1